MIEGSLLGDRFEPLELIDQGGVGTVYRGRDLQTGQLVAIKALKPEIIAQDPTLISRFKREGEALRQLNHPNIVQSIAMLEQDGQHYLVMEYVPGGSLEKLLKTEQRLSVERTLQIGLDIADALTRAHRLKIIHRDIKPANVLLAADGSPRLSDFGVAQVSDGHTGLTAVGAFLGTIAYLSPEVARGGAYDERSDIWALGVMLYEMLAGYNPFLGDNIAVTLNNVLNIVPPDLSDSRPDVPSEFAYLIDRMIAKDPEDRIGSIRSVGAEMETIIAQTHRARLKRTTDSQEVVRAKSNVNTTEDPTSPAPERGENPTSPTVPSSPTALRKPPTPAAPVAAADSSAPLTTPISPRPPTTPASPLGRMIVEDPRTQGIDKRRMNANPRVFVAYRREDTGEIARKIYDIFHRELGESDVARDVDRVANRTVNRVVLAQDIVASFDAMVVVIGKQFIGLQGTTGSGKPQTLFNPKDHLRIQLEAGLRRDDMLIVPVLVDGAPMPTLEQLPPTLQKIATKTPFQLDWTEEQGDAVFNAQIKKLIKQIRTTFNPNQRRWLMPVIAVIVLIVILMVLIAVFGGHGAAPGLIAPLMG